MSEGRLNRAYLSLGSNIQPEQNLPAAVRALSEFGRLQAVSRVWESPPYGVSQQAASGNFLNGALLLETELSASSICDEIILQVERKLGRVRDPRDKNAPRTIDVDLSLFNDEVLTVGRHVIPDPAILTRAFVARPLAEVAPDYRHPVAERTLAEIADELAVRQELWFRGDVALALNSSGPGSSR
ncbi:MAG TPA: 2-amino-4-hydroxy-6-hydroxymethyldihydropteridine diphosphokinase [Planctomycetaceae bacterium]|jgi:2-amino-4-hydroxy-6-hydroxymethyldihydropteridine diphosphokinase|nr:2-amino-4-hydroxy-6-hydroxymethyldihydropteridine diphosphokinase [Planctomycetaceae bacterium]